MITGILNVIAMSLVWFCGEAFSVWSSLPKSSFSSCYLCHDNRACKKPIDKTVVKTCRGEYCYKQDISLWGE